MNPENPNDWQELIKIFHWIFWVAVGGIASIGLGYIVIFCLQTGWRNWIIFEWLKPARDKEKRERDHHWL